MIDTDVLLRTSNDLRIITFSVGLRTSYNYFLGRSENIVQLLFRSIRKPMDTLAYKIDRYGLPGYYRRNGGSGMEIFTGT